MSTCESYRYYEVCIVGSGFAGAIIGKSLAENSINTVIIESGTDDGIKNSCMKSALTGLDVYENTGPVNYPIAESRSRRLGGTSNTWTGRSPRFHPVDFEINAYTPSDAVWPLSYGELEPYYERAEKTLMVSCGNLSACCPPRKNNFPVQSSWIRSPIQNLLNPLDITIDCSPTATGNNANSIKSKLLRIAGRNKFRVEKEILPEFSKTEYGSIITGQTATRLLSDKSGCITAIETKKTDGSVEYIKAQKYIIACGGIETPRLLLLSHSGSAPYGIGNNYDQVGRYFMEHPRINFYARINHRLSTIYPTYKIGRCYEFYERFKKKGLGSVRIGFVQSWIYPDDLKNITQKCITPVVKKLVKRIHKADFMVSTTCEMHSNPHNRITLSKDYKDVFGNPAANLYLNFSSYDLNTFENVRALVKRLYSEIGANEIYEEEISWTHHHMGTCRMGDNPKTSVVNRNLRVHGVPNLYVVGSSVFVTSGASPPTLTIAALSHRLADHIYSKISS